MQLGHPSQVVSLVVAIVREARELPSRVHSHGRKLRAQPLGVDAAVPVGPVHRGVGVVSGGGRGGGTDAALKVRGTSAVAGHRGAAALVGGHAGAAAGRSRARVGSAAFDVRRACENAGVYTMKKYKKLRRADFMQQNLLNSPGQRPEVTVPPLQQPAPILTHAPSYPPALQVAE